MEIILYILLPILFIAGFYWGRNRPRTSVMQTRIEEYPFYPFIVNEQGIVEFSQPLFTQPVRFLIKNKNPFASRQLIISVEQNIVRDVLPTEHLNNYMTLYNRYDGRQILLENDQ